MKEGKWFKAIIYTGVKKLLGMTGLQSIAITIILDWRNLENRPNGG